VLILGLIALTLLLTIGALSAGIQLPTTTWLEIVGRALIAMLPFTALAVAIGYLAKGPQSASPIINLIFFPMAFGSGLFIPLDGLPKVVQDIAPFLPAYHAGEFVRRAIARVTSRIYSGSPGIRLRFWRWRCGRTNATKARITVDHSLLDLDVFEIDVLEIDDRGDECRRFRISNGFGGC
jgi:ABC-2 type transport system permease protein